MALFFVDFLIATYRPQIPCSMSVKRHCSVPALISAEVCQISKKKSALVTLPVIHFEVIRI